MEEKTNINITSENGELVIRHGEALPQRDPRCEVLECTIGGVHEWILKRKDMYDLHPQNSLITYDTNEGAIHYTENVRDSYTHLVTGRITIDPELDKFRINCGKYISPDDLANRIRLLSHCFSNRSSAMTIVSALKNFKANVSRDIESSSDDRGSVKKLRHQVVESNLPGDFTIYTPLVKGGEKVSIRVEIFANEALDVTLFSYDLTEMLNETKNEIVRSEVERIKEMFPEIPVIEI